MTFDAQMPSRIIQPSDCKCGDCPYWNEDPNDGVYGECRRFPPAMSPRRASPTDPPPSSAQFPRVLCMDWCGEHPSAGAMVEHDTGGIKFLGRQTG